MARMRDKARARPVDGESSMRRQVCPANGQGPCGCAWVLRACARLGNQGRGVAAGSCRQTRGRDPRVALEKVHRWHKAAGQQAKMGGQRGRAASYRVGWGRRRRRHDEVLPWRGVAVQAAGVTKLQRRRSFFSSTSVYSFTRWLRRSIGGKGESG